MSLFGSNIQVENDDFLTINYRCVYLFDIYDTLLIYFIHRAGSIQKLYSRDLQIHLRSTN